MTVTHFCHGPIPRPLTWKPQESSNATSCKKGQTVQGDEEHQADEDLAGCVRVPHPVPELLKTQCAEQSILNEKYKQAHLTINTEITAKCLFVFKVHNYIVFWLSGGLLKSYFTAYFKGSRF